MYEETVDIIESEVLTDEDNSLVSEMSVQDQGIDQMVEGQTLVLVENMASLPSENLVDESDFSTMMPESVNVDMLVNVG